MSDMGRDANRRVDTIYDSSEDLEEVIDLESNQFEDHLLSSMEWEIYCYYILSIK